MTCSFCGKSASEVEIIIQGPGVCICGECVDLCNQIIVEHHRHAMKKLGMALQHG